MNKSDIDSNRLIDIKYVLSKLSKTRQIFVSEADFQLELAWVIKTIYPNAIIRLEYCPYFDLNMHIDILVIINNKWIPIELKYKTKKCQKTIDNEVFNLKNHGAKDISRYLYLKDLERIETFKKKSVCFSEGYAIFVTNEMSYTKPPKKDNCVYSQFSLHDGNIKSGIMDWREGTSDGTKKGCEKPIELSGHYKMEWLPYSEIDNTNTGVFKILVNTVK